MKRKSKILGFIFAILMMIISIPIAYAASYPSSFRYWSQGQSDYLMVRKYGCWIVAQAKLIYETGVDRSHNPDTYGVWEDNNNLIPDIYSDVNQIDGAHAPVIYANQKSKSLEYLGEWGAEDNQLWYNINAGYYTILKVNDGKHYVYLDNEKSKETGQLYIDDSSSDNYYAGPRPLSDYTIRNSGYVYKTNGNNVDTESPVIERAYIDIPSMTSNSYKVMVKATDNIGVTQVKVPTWTLKKDANGEEQDDLIWHEATYNSSTGYWEYTVKASDHNNEIDIYRTHAYAYDAKGNRSTSYTLQFIPMGSTLNHNLPDQFVARITAYGLDQTESWVIGLASTSGTSIRLNLRPKNYEDDSQIWNFRKNSDNTYSIINAKTDLSIDVEGGENIGGRLFLAFTKNSQDNQKFYLMNYNGGIRIVPKISTDLKGMDLKGAQLVDGANFELYESRELNKTNQTFAFQKVATDITLSETDISLNANETKQINVSYTPTDTYLKEVTYTSSDNNIVTVSSTGLITAKTKGTATITVTTKDGSNINKNITVTVKTKNGIINENGKDYYYIDDVIQKGLIKADTKVLYAKSNGILQKGLITIKNNKYYFQDDYSMAKGIFITIDGKIYYFGATSGILQKSGWFTKNNNIYYLDKTTGEAAVGLKQIENDKYYFNETGAMQKGRITIEGKDYYFDSTGRMVFGEFIKIDGKLYYFGATSGALQKKGWFTKDGSMYYLDKTTGEVAVGLKIIDTGTYYFDNNGKIVKGEFIKIDGKLYYFGATSGTLQKSGWYTKNNNKYYLDKTTGEVAVGLKKIGNYKYYFNEAGIMQNGRITIEGKDYYFDPAGKMVLGEFIKIDGKLYYFGATSGALQKKGWFTKNDSIYYLDKTTGEVAIGLKIIDTGTYYFDNSGKIVKGEFIKIDGKLYYFGATSGTLQKSGWYTKNNNKYYLDKTTGEVAVGLKKIDTGTYYFNSTGIMQKGKIKINGNEYFFDKDGKMVFGEFIEIDNKLYYFGATSGILQKKGWFTKNNNTYYLDKTTGEVAVGLKTINTETYYFGSDGKMIKGNFVTIDNKLYYFGAASGTLQKSGWFTKNGKKYYLDKITGEVYTGIVTIGNVEYEFDQNGVWQSGWKTENNKTYYIYLNGQKATDWVTIAGVKCYFNSLGELIEKNAKKIIDVSHHNGSIDWDTVKTTDVDGAIIRLGYGTSYTTDDPFVDRYWDYNYDNTVNKDLLFGVYLYSYAIDEVSANLEADFAIRYLNQRNFDKNRTFYYDLEENQWTTNLTSNDYDIIIRTFINRLAAEGYKVEVYTYKYWAENKLSEYGRSQIGWMAHYTDTCGYQGSYTGWQYTANGSVEGINGDVDISVFKKI